MTDADDLRRMFNSRNRTTNSKDSERFQIGHQWSIAENRTRGDRAYVGEGRDKMPFEEERKNLAVLEMDYKEISLNFCNRIPMKLIHYLDDKRLPNSSLTFNDGSEWELRKLTVDE